MSILLLRRFLGERLANSQQDRNVQLSRCLMDALDRGNAELDMQTLAKFSLAERKRVFAHLLQLVRGEDYESLLAIADIIGLPDVAIQQISTHDARRKVNAMRQLERFPVARSIDVLLDCMVSDIDYAVRLEAAAVLARLDRLPAPFAVIEALDIKRRPLNRIHGAIFRSFAAQYPIELCELLSDRSLANVKPLVVEALGWSSDFSVLPWLAEQAHDCDPEVRCAAVKAARKLGHPSAGRWVLPLLLDPVAAVRVQAARACGSLGIDKAIPILSSLIENPSWWVRMRAAEALSMLRPAQPAPYRATGVRK